MVWMYYDVPLLWCPMYFLFFCRTTITRNTLMTPIFVIVTLTILKVQLWKFLDISYVWSSLWDTLAMAFERHLIVEDFNLRVNFSRVKSWNQNGWRCLGSYQVEKTSEPAIRRTLHQDISLIIALLFFCLEQTKFLN